MSIFTILALIVVLSPTLVLFLLGGASVIGRPFSERRISQFVQVGIVTGLLAAVTVLALMLLRDVRRVPVELGHWVVLHSNSEQPLLASDHHPEHPLYHFSFKLEFDRLSVPFVILTFVLCGTIGAFADNYMHRERGFNRFFTLYSMFVTGMVLTSLAGTIETLFTGWELVGLSSALLVAFFQERPNPCSNGLRVWAVYRLSDAGLLIGALLLHHLKGEGDFDQLMGVGSWPEGVASLSPSQAFTVGLWLLVAVAGKSALIPFSGWLPRAMEGPTPSSAVFYGALSVHLGAFLLLRISPILAVSGWLTLIVISLGLGTALLAAFTGRVQTDIKSALSFASLTQIGFIVAEVGAAAWLGHQLSAPWLLYLPLIHILGHGCLRTLQFVRAPTLLHDYRVLENAIGARLPLIPAAWQARLSPGRLAKLYRLALHRGYLDEILDRWIVGPVAALFRGCDRAERLSIRWIAGQAKSSHSDKPMSSSD